MPIHPALKLDTLNGVSPYTKRLGLAACRAGRTYEDLNGFLVHAKSNFESNAMCPSLLPVFYDNLSSAPSDDAIEEHLLCQTIALEGLAFIIHAASRAIPGSVAIYLWLRAWPSFCFVREHWAIHPERDTRSYADFIAIAVILCEFCVGNPLAQGKIIGTPNLPQVLGEAWALLGDVQPGTFNGDVPAHFPYLVDSLRLGSKKNFPQLVEGAGGTIKHLARAFEGHASQLAAQCDSLSTQISHLISLVDEFDGVKDTSGATIVPLGPLGASLRTSSFVKTITRILFDLTMYDPNRAPEHFELFDPMSNIDGAKACLHILCRIFHETTEEHIPAALKAGLLQCIAIYAPLADPSSRMETYLNQLASRAIPSSATSRTVVRTLRAVFREGSEARKLMMSEPFLHCPLSGEQIGEDLVQLAQSRIVLLDLIEGESFVEKKACDNVTCGKIAPKAEFKRCVCETVHYCSEPCQRRDWKEGSHRLYCDLATGVRSGLGSWDMPTRDRAFLRACTSQLYHSGKADILANHVRLLSERHASGAPQDPLDENFAVFFNLFSNPPSVLSISARRLQEYMASSFTELPDWFRRAGIRALAGGDSDPVLADEAYGQPGLLQLHVIIFHLGGRGPVRIVPLRSSSPTIFDGVREIARRAAGQGWSEETIQEEVREMLARCGDVEEIHA
ncbi:MYND-type domain-containing protein [Mycena kentingensis (nom. inval.)]|nr:MYND-type domain-containing protein [Mycena kentingensis (nom. inval.)]